MLSSGSSSDSCGTGCQEENGSCGFTWSWGSKKSLVSRADPNPTCPKSNNTIYTSETGNQYNITCSLDHSGGDLKMVWVSSNKIADCLAECDATEGCKAIAMSGTACYMKSKIGTPVKSSNVRGAVWVGKVDSSASSSASSTASATSGTSSSAIVSSSTSLISSSTVSYSNSSSTSSSSSAFPTSTSPTCPAANNTVFIAESGATFLIECYVDYSGGDLKSVNIGSNRIADCVNACDATDGCIDISMSGTACYMKKKLGRTHQLKQQQCCPSTTSSSVMSTSSSFSPSTSSSASSTSSDAVSTSSKVSSSVILTTGVSTANATSSHTLTNSTVSISATSSSSVISSSAVVSFNSTSSKFSSSSFSSSNISSSSVVVGPTAPIGTGASSGVPTSLTSGAPYGNGTSSTVSAGPTIPITSEDSSSTVSSTVASLNSTSTVGSSTSTILVNNTSTVVSSRTSIIGPTIPIGTGPSGGVSSSTTSGAPYGNGTTSTVSVGPTVPIGTGISFSSAIPVNSTSSTVTVPIAVGPSSGISSSTTSGAPYSNGATSVLPVGPTGTGVSSSVITSKTVIVSPIGTGASSGVSSSTTSGAPYGNDTTSALPVGPTGTGISSIVTSSSTSSALNSSLSLTTSYNLTSSIASTVLTMSANSTVSAPLTTAPIVTGPSTAISTSSGRYTNTTSSAPTTSSASTTYDFNNWGGIKSDHPVATNTTACSRKPTSTATCVRCEGQPGTDKYCGLTINDDSYAVVPKTCNQVEYSLDLTECTVAPDGVSRKALCINGQFPGPLLEASWGDEVIVHVTNSMTRNGTSIHWHGIRQNHTNEMDGVVGVTQCALAPGQTMTYKWIAESYGFSWYHSHLTLQAYEGLFGPMYIDGPKSADFDVDAGHLIINDWSHIPVDDMYNDAQVAGVRTMDSGLINGMNINPLAKGDITGARYTVPTEFVPGKKYLFQLLNSAIQSTYKFYIDGHKFTVIAADFVPIEPYETTVLTINVGQRYEIIVEADQEVGDYFLRFDNQNACASTINSDDIRGIIHYAGSPGGTPNSTAYTYPRKGQWSRCSPHQTVQHDVAVSNSNGINLYRWYLDGTTFQANWGDATLYNIVNNDTIPTYSGDLAIETSLGEAPNPFARSRLLCPRCRLRKLRFRHRFEPRQPLPAVMWPLCLEMDPPDKAATLLLPSLLTILAYGSCMYCHIGWHVAMGFALQFIEGKEQIKNTVSDTCLLNDVCTTWRPWTQEKGIYVDDSGV
ncbi:unnamed protein product [Aureobasidium pullulans]|nr:unnamed protein product [Aureobasidium pullulans]